MEGAFVFLPADIPVCTDIYRILHTTHFTTYLLYQYALLLIHIYRLSKSLFQVFPFNSLLYNFFDSLIDNRVYFGHFLERGE